MKLPERNQNFSFNSHQRRVKSVHSFHERVLEIALKYYSEFQVRHKTELKKHPEITQQADFYHIITIKIVEFLNLFTFFPQNRDRIFRTKSNFIHKTV